MAPILFVSYSKIDTDLAAADAYRGFRLPARRRNRVSKTNAFPNRVWERESDETWSANLGLRFRFGRNRRLAGSLGQGLFDGAPGEHRAFDALRKFSHALEQLKVAQVFRLPGFFAGH